MKVLKDIYKNTLEEVTKASIQLLLKEPFFGHFFTSLLKATSEDTDSMATTFANKQMMKLIINEKFWHHKLKGKTEEQTKQLRYGAIKHQILHIVFKHMLDITKYGNKQIYNIAADLAVNQYLTKEQLPDDAITFDDFPELKMDREKGIPYYYNKISQHVNEESDEINLSISDSREEQPEAVPGAGTEAAPPEPEPEKDDIDKEVEAYERDEAEDLEYDEDEYEEEVPKTRLQELLEGDNEYLKQHDFWLSPLSKAELKIIDGYINDTISNSIKRIKDKSYGSLPGGLKEYIDLLMDEMKPKVNWRRVLRLFAESSSRTYLKNTIRRVSKRYGTVPGLKLKKKHKILVAVDTSGSVNNAELKEFFAEIYHIWKQGAEVFVVECDAAIHHKYYYKGFPPESISGRGGTDFNEPIRFANEEYIPDAIIYFTDGYAPVPHVISRKPILWVITSNGISTEDEIYQNLPQRKIKIE